MCPDGIPVRTSWGPQRMPFPIANLFSGQIEPVIPGQHGILKQCYTSLIPRRGHIPELYQTVFPLVSHRFVLSHFFVRQESRRATYMHKGPCTS